MVFFWELIPFQTEFETILYVRLNIDFEKSVKKSIVKMILQSLLIKLKLMTFEEILEMDNNKNSFIHHFLNTWSEFTYTFQKEIYEIKKIFLQKLNIPCIGPYKKWIAKM